MDLADISDPVEKYETMSRCANEAERAGFDAAWRKNSAGGGGGTPRAAGGANQGRKGGEDPPPADLDWWSGGEGHAQAGGAVRRCVQLQRRRGDGPAQARGASSTLRDGR